MTDNQNAFLDMLAYSEIGPELLSASNDGYNVIVGSTPRAPDLFYDYSDHPRKLVHLNDHLSSTAAGRYQILARYFDHYKKELGLPDFSPASQDAIALRMIREQHAFQDVIAGRVRAAIAKCCNIWASLPGSPYGQHTNKLEDLIKAYIDAGGVLSQEETEYG